MNIPDDRHGSTPWLYPQSPRYARPAETASSAIATDAAHARATSGVKRKAVANPRPAYEERPRALVGLPLFVDPRASSTRRRGVAGADEKTEGVASSPAASNYDAYVDDGDLSYSETRASSAGDSSSTVEGSSSACGAPPHETASGEVRSRLRPVRRRYDRDA